MTFQSVRNLYAYDRAHDNAADEPLTPVDEWGALIDTHGDCANSPAPQKWLPLPGFTEIEYDQYAEWACRGCPVMTACGLYALATGREDGVWGGMAQHRLNQARQELTQSAYSDLIREADVERGAQVWSVP